MNNDAGADIVLGQSNFEEISAAASRTKLNRPHDIFRSGRMLFVTDTINHRAIAYSLDNLFDDDLGPQFSQGKAVVGKVYWDFNGNGKQDDSD